MKRRPSAFTWLFVVGMFGLILSLQLLISRQEVEQVGVQEAMTLIKDGQIAKMVVTDNRMTLTLSTGEEYEAYKPIEASYAELYEFYNVTQQDLSSIEIQESEQTIWDSLVSILLSLGPVLLLIWIFTRGLRRKRWQ